MKMKRHISAILIVLFMFINSTEVLAAVKDSEPVRNITNNVGQALTNLTSTFNESGEEKEILRSDISKEKPKVLDIVKEEGRNITIKWTSVIGASEYEIKINDKVYISNETSFRYVCLQKDNIYNISVRGKNEDIYTQWSEINKYTYSNIEKQAIDRMLKQDSSKEVSAKSVQEKTSISGVQAAAAATAALSFDLRTYGYFGRNDSSGKPIEEWAPDPDPMYYQYNGPQAYPIRKFKITLANKPTGLTIKYQVFIKENNAWQAWKTEGQEAGELGKTITSVRIKLDGTTYNYGVKYSLYSSLNDATPYVSEIASDGYEPKSSLANTKPVCMIYMDLYKSSPISQLNLNTNPVVISGNYEVPSGQTFTIPAGKQLKFDYSSGVKPSILVNGTLNLSGTSASPITFNDAGGIGQIIVGNQGNLVGSYTNFNRTSTTDGLSYINNSGGLSIANSNFTSTAKVGSAINTQSNLNVKITNSSIKNFDTGISITGTNANGSVEVSNSIIESNRDGIAINDGISYKSGNKIDIINNTSIGKNGTGIRILREGEEPVHRPINIINNVMDSNTDVGVYIRANRINNITLNKNTIKNTNKSRTKLTVPVNSYTDGGPIYVDISNLKEEGVDNFKNINVLNATNKNVLTGNNFDATVITGTVNNNITINNGSNSYLIDNLLLINKGKRLTVGEGTKLGALGGITANGELLLSGTSANPIVVNSVHDTNYPITHVFKQADKDMNGNMIESSTDGVINASYVKIFNGGLKEVKSGQTNIYPALQSKGQTTLSNISIDNVLNKTYNGVTSTAGKLIMADSSVKNAQYGVYVSGGQADFNKNNISNNKYGLSLNNLKASNITKSEVSNNELEGISLMASTVNIYNSNINTNGTNIYVGGKSNSKILNNNIKGAKNDGIDISSDSTAVINYNNIAGNKVYGVYSSSSTTINGEYNYWGNAKGPSYSYVDGIGTKWTSYGDKVSTGVDYNPAIGTEITGIDLGIGEDGISQSILTFLNDYSYSLKKQMSEEGINLPGGNYTKSYSDLVVNTAALDIQFGRSYSSRNANAGILGKGWKFYYEAGLKDIKAENPNVNVEGKVVYLPGGQVCTFEKLSSGQFVSYDSRNTLKLDNGKYIVENKDKDKYTFDSTGLLISIGDKSGNEIKFEYSSSKISRIYDNAGREYIFTYTNNLLTSIQEKINTVAKRKIQYQYVNNLLTYVTDVNGNIQETYKYDTSSKLYTILQGKDGSTTLEKVIYFTDGENKDKISSYEDIYGNKYNYSYDNTNRKVTETDKSGRKRETFYDKNLFVTSKIDEDGNSTITEYALNSDGSNLLGEEVKVKDVNNNYTSYLRDNNGNVITSMDPEGKVKQNFYDKYNNVIKTLDKDGDKKFYIYDSEGKNLLKEAIPLNGKDEYSDSADQSKFSITLYEYYNSAKVNGIIKSITNGDKEKIQYSYKDNGDLISETNEDGKVTGYSINDLGFKESQTSPKGEVTRFTYDNKGNLLTETNAAGDIKEVVYDVYGRIINEISPNLYGKKDASNNKLFNKKYTYYSSGNIESVTDGEGNKTIYTYDYYGNKVSEIRANKSTLFYEYDALKRVKKISYKEDTNSEVKVIEENSYSLISNGLNSSKVQQTNKSYSGTGVTLQSQYIYNYENKLVQKVNEDGTTLVYDYNSNGDLSYQVDEKGSPTYYVYDGLKKLVKKYIPFEKDSTGNIKYKYEGYKYSNAGNKIQQVEGIDLVAKDGSPTNLKTTNYEYYGNDKVKKVTDNEGRKTEYTYDNNGNLIKALNYKNDSEAVRTEYEYDNLNRIVKINNIAREGDIAGNLITSDKEITLTTVKEYDKNGNLTKTTYPNGDVYQSSYDNLDRAITNTKIVKDASGVKNTYNSQLSYYGDTDKISSSTDFNGNKITNSYNGLGQLKEMVTGNSKVQYSYDYLNRLNSQAYLDAGTTKSTSKFSYDNRGNLKSEEVAYTEGATAKTVTTKAFKYDEVGNKIKELDGVALEKAAGANIDEKITNGYGMTYEYNLQGLDIKQLDPESKDKGKSFTIQKTYDGLGRIIEKLDVNGNKFNYSYNNSGKVLEEGYTKAGTTSKIVLSKYTYDKLDNLLTYIDGNNAVTTYTINSLGKVKSIKTSQDASIGENVVNKQYDVMGYEALSEDSAGKVNNMVYNTEGKLIKESEADKSGNSKIEKIYGYDGNSNLTYLKDGNGNVEEYTYNNLNLVDKKELNDKLLESYSYDNFGNKLSTTDKFNNKISYSYDALNRLVEVKDGANKVVEKLQYYSNGLQSKSIDALSNTINFSYDKNNKLINTVDASGNESKKTYDAMGNIATTTDGNGNTTKYNYDGLNRLISVENALGIKTEYSYDNNGNLLTQKDGNGNITNYKYNVKNKLWKITAPNTGDTTGKIKEYTYNPNETVSAYKDRNGNTINYTYDIHGRKIKEVNGAKTVEYQYDNNNNITVVKDDAGVTERAYDEENRITSKTVGDLGTLDVEYDVATTTSGYHQEVTTDPKGGIVKRTFDNSNRLVSVDDGQNVTKYNYYDNGAKKETVFSDNSKEEYLFNNNLTLKQLNIVDNKGTLVENYKYSYDKNNNILSKVDKKGTTAYTYDKLNRISAITMPDTSTKTYSYDNAGNILTEKTSLNSTVLLDKIYSYDSENRLTKTTETGTVTKTENSYSYDNNGNLIKEINKDAINNSVTKERDLTYDGYNRLTEVKEGNKSLEKNTYNSEGLRIKKESEGKNTTFFYDGNKAILELNGSKETAARNVYGTKLISREVGDEKASYRYNGHGDVVKLYDTSGDVVGNYYYDAFGNITEKEESFDNPFKYSSYPYDDETGYYYLKARMYDPQDARFLQEDSYRGDINDPLSLNLYAYCNNNPLIYDDPTGHWPSLSNIWNGVKSFVSSTISITKSVINTTIDVAKGIGAGALSFVQSTVSGLASVGKGLVGIVTNPKKAVQAAKEVVSTAVILSKPGVLQGIVATGLEDIKKGFKDNVINGTAYTRSKYITEITLNVGSLFIGAGEIKAASGLNKAGSISKLAKLEKATGLLDDAARAADKADDVLRYTSKVENILEDGGALLGKSTKGGNKFGKIIGGADNAAEKKLTTAACFVAGTVVLTNVGYESIEKIKAGDTVYSQNAETGEKGYKKVVRTFQKEVDTLVYLKIGSKEIVTTENHPFYVEGKGFVHAGELKEGEKVVTASGETLTVDKVNIEKTKEKTKVYNFEVEDWHTYFVSTEEILVHNDCRAPLPEGMGKVDFIVDTDGTAIPMKNSYKKFNELKRDLGNAPKGEAKHHIVEQNPTNKSQFLPEMIQNKQNVIDLNDAAGEVHRQITGFYNSKPSYLSGQKVRDYVSSMSFGDQFEFGMNQIKDYGDVIWDSNKGWIFKPFK